MDEHEFDRLTRRFVLGSLAAALGLGTTPIPDGVTARKRKNKRVKRNEFGCVNVGDFCKNGGQCCSGICRGRKGKRKCKAHDSGGCQAGQFEAACVALTPDVPCTTSGIEGRCDTTTGGAGYCRNHKRCLSCKKDQDCVPFCGADAACIVCPDCGEETGGTACVGLEPCPL
jgi:hypothetical protein